MKWIKIFLNFCNYVKELLTYKKRKNYNSNEEKNVLSIYSFFLLFFNLYKNFSYILY